MCESKAALVAYSSGKKLLEAAALFARFVSLLNVSEPICFFRFSTDSSKNDSGRVELGFIYPALTQFLIVADETPMI